MDYTWKRAPLLRLLPPFVAGILLAAYLPVSIPIPFLICLILLGILAGVTFFRNLHDKYALRWVHGGAVYLLLIAFGYLLCIGHVAHYDKGHILHHLDAGMLEAEVVNAPQEKERSVKTIVEVRQLSSKEAAAQVQGKVLLYLEKDERALKLQHGDKFLFQSKLNFIVPPQNPGEFDYRQYLSFHQIYVQSYAKSTQWHFAESLPPTLSIYRWAHQLRSDLLDIFRDAGIEGDEMAVVSALVLGYKNDLDDELRRAYASAGAMHVLAVSGLHVGIIYLVLAQLLSFLDRFRHGPIIRAVLVLLALWLYALITGLSPSVIRAATMFSFVIISKASKRNSNIYNTLAASAILLLLINPFLIMEVGFQLSYLAVLGIVFIQPPLYELIKVDNWLLDKVWGITAVSIAAQIATFPLGLLYFHQFPNYFLISNLVVIPAATVVIYTGILVLISSPFAWLQDLLALGLNYFVKALNAAILFIEKMPYSISEGISFSIAETWFIYFLIGLLLIYLSLRRIRLLKLGLVCCCLFMVWQVISKIERKNQRMLVVYNVKNTSAVDFVNGQNSLFIAESELLNDPQKMLFHIKHNWWDLGLDQAKALDRSLLPKVPQKNSAATIHGTGNFVDFCDKTIAYVDSSFCGMSADSPIQVDFAIITGNNRCPLKDMTQLIAAETWIVDSSTPRWMVKRWEEEAGDLDLSFYSVRERGAFIAKL